MFLGSQAKIGYLRVKQFLLGPQVSIVSSSPIETLDVSGSSRFEFSGNPEIRGFAAPSTINMDTMLFVVNKNAANLVVKHESGSPTAVNRIRCPNDVDMEILPRGSAILQYNSGASRWDVLWANRVVTKTEVGLSNVDNTSDATKNAAAVALTNKTIDADLNTISNIENADIKASAGIVYSKLALSNSIVNADVNSSAAIAYSKLALSDSIVNADVNSAAAIAMSKLAPLTADRALISNGSGVVSTSSVSSTELGRLIGVTSSVQTQLNAAGINDAPLTNYLKTYAKATFVPGTLGTIATTGTISAVTPDLFYADTTSGSAALTRPSSTALRGANNYLTATGASNSTGDRFVQFPAFALETSDLGKPLSISFDVTGVTTDGNWDVVMVRYNSSGVHQEIISIAGNASSGTTPVSAKLPTGTTQFNGFFIPGSTAGDLYALRLRSLANTVQIRVDNLFVGPQPVRVGAAVTDWQSYTPGYTGISIGNGSITGQYRRVGDSAEIKIGVNFNTTGVVNGQLKFNLPTGLTVDVNKLAAGSYKLEGQALAQVASNLYTGSVIYQIADNTLMVLNGGGNTTVSFWNATQPNTWAANSFNEFYLKVSVPISNWSSNVTMADRAVESYAFNTSTSTTASDTTSFGYGAGGAQIQLITAGLQRRVRFPDTIQPTDSLIFEVSGDQKQWFPLSSGAAVVNGSTIGAWAVQSSTTYGVGRLWQINSTDVDVSFGQFSLTTGGAWTATGQSYGGGLSTAYWRVRKVSGGAQVGYPISSANIVGRTDGLAPASGYVGEYLEATASADTGTSAANTYTFATGLTLTLTPGTWMIGYDVTLLNASGAAGAAVNAALTTSGGAVVGNTVSIAYPAISGAELLSTSRRTVVNISASTEYQVRIRSSSATANSCYLIAQSSTGGLTNPDNHSNIWAQRIA